MDINGSSEIDNFINKPFYAWYGANEGTVGCAAKDSVACYVSVHTKKKKIQKEGTMIERKKLSVVDFTAITCRMQGFCLRALKKVATKSKTYQNIFL